MSIAHELLSLKREGLISADDVAFAIRELKAGASAAPHEEKITIVQHVYAICHLSKTKLTCCVDTRYPGIFILENVCVYAY